MLSMMDHITTRLSRLDEANVGLKTDKKELKLRFDRRAQRNSGEFVICGDVFLRKR